MRGSESGEGKGGDEDSPSENTGRHGSYDRLDSAGASGDIVLRVGLTASVSKAFRAIS